MFHTQRYNVISAQPLSFHLFGATSTWPQNREQTQHRYALWTFVLISWEQQARCIMYWTHVNINSIKNAAENHVSNPWSIYWREIGPLVLLNVTMIIQLRHGAQKEMHEILFVFVDKIEMNKRKGKRAQANSKDIGNEKHPKR